MTIQTLKIDLATYKKDLIQAQAELNSFEYSISEHEYDDMIDDLEPIVLVMGIEFKPSEVIKNLDYTAYRCGKSDYESSYDLDDCEEYQEIKEKISDLEIEIESLEEKISDLESEV
jgi:hypothetical protein